VGGSVGQILNFKNPTKTVQNTNNVSVSIFDSDYHSEGCARDLSCRDRDEAETLQFPTPETLAETHGEMIKQ